MTANGLIVSAMAILFLIFGYLGVPVAFALIAGVVIGTLFTPVSLPSISPSCSTASMRSH